MAGEYPLILATLREFDLITVEQQEEKMEEWYAHWDDYEARREAFRDQWIAEREKSPWWVRATTSSYGWVDAWFKQEEEKA